MKPHIRLDPHETKMNHWPTWHASLGIHHAFDGSPSAALRRLLGHIVAWKRKHCGGRPSV